MSFVTITTLVLAVDGAQLTCQATPDVSRAQADCLCDAVAEVLAPGIAPATLKIKPAGDNGLSAWLEINTGADDVKTLPEMNVSIMDQPELTDLAIKSFGVQLARDANEYAHPIK